MRNRHAVLMFGFAVSGAVLLAVIGTKAYHWDFMPAFVGFLIFLLVFMYLIFKDNYLNR